MLTFINRMGITIFCIGISLAESENLLIPLSLVILGLIITKVTNKVNE